MAKIDPNFPYSIFNFLHLPIRDMDEREDNFLERYLVGEQTVWESYMQKLLDLPLIFDPDKCPEHLLYYLKDIVGLTKELDNITRGLAVDDLRKIILLAVPLWRQKGIELGFGNIIRLFTGFNSRIFNWFDYRMIIGEKAIGEEQLGEDAWLVSLPGFIQKDTEGEAILLFQFEKSTLDDGSEFNNIVTPYGYYDFIDGGPFAQSNKYLLMNNFCMTIPHRQHFDFSGNFTIETQFFTNKDWSQPLFYKEDIALGKEISLWVDTSADTITVNLDDGSTASSATFPAGTILKNGSWHKIAWVVDWTVGLTGEQSVWVDGTRVYNAPLSGAFVPALLNTTAPIFIGGTSISGTGLWGGLDAYRVTTDARYNVSLPTITHPTTNFIEYQAEELDEFQMDIRVVDDGSLDRLLTQRLLNLMRPSSERLNIRYIDFYDDFEFGKGQFTTLAGSSVIEDIDGLKVLKLGSGALEHVQIGGSDDWDEYITQFRCSVKSGTQMELRLLVQDEDNYYAYLLDTDTKMAYLQKSVAGVRTNLAPPVEVDIEPANLPLYQSFYMLMVSSMVNETTGTVTIRAFLDSNPLFIVDDTSFLKGTLALHAPAGSEMWCSETEMFQMPLESDRINPNPLL